MKKFKSLLDFKDKNRINRLVALALMVIFGVVGTMLIIRSFAAPPSLYLVPANSSVQTGSDITVTLRLSAGDPVNAVEATITYDQTKLQYKSVDGTTSGFPVGVIATGGNGSVNIVRGINNTSVSTDVEVAKITFTALGSSSTNTSLALTGEAANNGTNVGLTFVGATVNITAPTVTTTATYTIEPTVAAPLVGNQFGLRVYVTSSSIFKGGEVTVNLPTGLAYQGTLDTTGSAFNPATTVAGTTAQSVHLVFVTQSTTLTGKQLVATIPVIGSTVGAKSVTFSGARVADVTNTDFTTVTANPFSITVNSASLPAPVVTVPGKTQIASSENVTNLKQTFSITNFDSAATYTVTLNGQSLSVTNGSFSIPSSMRNGDLPLQVAAAKNGASGNATYTIRLRSPNVNRTACVELLDLLVVNDGYGRPSTELDLNFDGNVSLIDLLTVTGKWGEECI